MAIVKQSFISNILGRNAYNKIKYYAKKVLVVGTSILCLLFALSLICHFGFISDLLSLVTGTSILFLAYIVSLIIVLDKEVDVDEPDPFIKGNLKKKPKPKSYKLTVVWSVILIAVGGLAIFFSNKYRKHYAFECSTFLVDNQACIYHLDFDNGCEDAAKSNNLEKMQGFQIDKTYIFCEWCKEWAEDAEFDAAHDYSNI